MVPLVADSIPATPNVPPAPEIDNTKQAQVGTLTSSSETLETLTQAVESDSREPNTIAIDRQNEKEKEIEKARGGSKPGVPRGPYKKTEGKRAAGSTGKSTVADVAAMRESDEKYRRCYQAGVETIEALVQTGAQLGGNEWQWRPPSPVTLPDGKIIKVSEQERGHEVFGRGFAANGWEGPSPTMTMFIFSLGFLASRLNQPETQKKVLGVWDKMKLWYAERQIKKHRADIKPAPKEDKNAAVKS